MGVCFSPILYKIRQNMKQLYGFMPCPVNYGSLWLIIQFYNDFYFSSMSALLYSPNNSSFDGMSYANGRDTHVVFM